MMFKKFAAVTLAAMFAVVTLSSDVQAKDRDHDQGRYNQSNSVYTHKKNKYKKVVNSRTKDLRQRYLADGKLSRKERARLQQLKYRQNSRYKNRWANRYQANSNIRYNTPYNNNYNTRYNTPNTSVLGRYLGYGR